MSFHVGVKAFSALRLLVWKKMAHKKYMLLLLLLLLHAAAASAFEFDFCLTVQLKFLHISPDYPDITLWKIYAVNWVAAFALFKKKYFVTLCYYFLFHIFDVASCVLWWMFSFMCTNVDGFVDSWQFAVKTLSGWRRKRQLVLFRMQFRSAPKMISISLRPLELVIKRSWCWTEYGGTVPLIRFDVCI